MEFLECKCSFLAENSRRGRSGNSIDSLWKLGNVRGGFHNPRELQFFFLNIFLGFFQTFMAFSETWAESRHFRKGGHLEKVAEDLWNLH